MTLRIERTDAPTDEERQAILAPLRALSLIHISEPTRPY